MNEANSYRGLMSPEDYCEIDGVREDGYGGEHYWHCDTEAILAWFDGEGWLLLCESHAEQEGAYP